MKQWFIALKESVRLTLTNKRRLLRYKKNGNLPVKLLRLGAPTVSTQRIYPYEHRVIEEIRRINSEGGCWAQFHQPVHAEDELYDDFASRVISVDITRVCGKFSDLKIDTSKDGVWIVGVFSPLDTSLISAADLIDGLLNETWMPALRSLCAVDHVRQVWNISTIVTFDIAEGPKHENSIKHLAERDAAERSAA